MANAKNIKENKNKILDLNQDNEADEVDSMFSDDDDLKYIPDDELEVCRYKHSEFKFVTCLKFL